MNAGRWRSAWDQIHTSFWFVPSLMIAAAAILAPAAVALDAVAVRVRDGAATRLIYHAEPGTARDLVATLLTAMMTMTSLIFSISMVVLTLAASQFGPRLVRNFMASRQTQVVLGLYVMTVIYCLLVLAMLGGSGEAGPRPWPSATLALALVAASVALLAVFQHGLARSIMSETVVRRVGVELDASILELDPLGEPPDPHPERHLPPGFASEAARFGPREAGYVRAIDFGAMVEAAAGAGCIVGLSFRAGDFVVTDGKGIALHPPGACTTELARQLRAAIVIGPDRTPVQDLAFSIRHLVEVAVRAMSPSLNDPYTAISAIDQISASLALLMGRALPPGLYRDAGGRPRVICPVATHDSLIAAAFDQIRQNGAEKPHVAIHLLEAIERLAPHARLPGQVRALEAQAHLVLADAERRIDNRSDLEAVRRRATAAEAALGRQRSELARAADPPPAPARRLGAG